MRKLIAAGAATIVAAATLPAVAASAGAAPGAGCAGFIALIVPGTGETSNSADPSVPAGLLAAVGNELEGRYGNSIETVYVPYPAAAFATGVTYADSATDGIRNVEKQMEKCPDSQYVLTGFSQGAQVANDVAVKVGNGDSVIPASNLKSVALVANPRRGTPGAEVIGPDLPGEGIAGPNPAGFGALQGRVFDLCHPEDKYCNIEGEHGFLKSLGASLGNDLGGASTEPQGGESNSGEADSPELGAARELGPDYSQANLTAAVGVAENLPDQIGRIAEDPTSPSALADLHSVGQQASLVAETFTPVAETRDWLSTNQAAQDSLTDAPDDSPLSAVSTVLGQLNDADLPGMVNSATTIVDAVSTALGGGGTGGLQQASSAASNISSGVSGLTGTPMDTLSTAGSALSSLQPVTLIDQTLKIVAHVTSVDYLGVADDFGRLGAELISGNIPAAHATAGGINNALSPLVMAIDEIPLSQVGQVLSMIPEPTARMVGMVVSLLDNLDVIGLAKAVGELQEVAWEVVETGNPLALAQVLPIGMRIASIGMGVFTGGSDTPASELHSGPNELTAQMGDQARSSDLIGLGQSAVEAATSQDGASLMELVDSGFTAATFLGSGVHGAYTNWSPNGDGRSATDVVADKFSAAIGG